MCRASLAVKALTGSVALGALLLLVTAVSAQNADPYDDVAGTGPDTAAIEALRRTGILDGTECGRDLFCPEEPMQRWVMAIWLVRALDGRDPAGTSDTRFADAAWVAHVDRLAELGVTEGCDTNPLRFCPGEPVTRSQMASFLTRAFDLPAPDRAIGYPDVGGHQNLGAIEAVTAARIAEACSTDPLAFCPRASVTRGQMAVLLARALDLVPPAPYQPLSDPTPLPIDPATRTGTLPNGLTYYLRSNAEPGDSVTLRLVVKAGSINEPTPGSTVAHFLAHMLFEGTAAYPGDSLDETLRSVGVNIGNPDRNSGVGHETSVYQMSVPTDRPGNVGTALHVLSQMAHAATLDTDELVAERGTLLNERHLWFESPFGQIRLAFDGIYTTGTPYEGYWRIGPAESIARITAADLRDFYETWYVPGNMAIVAVGDMPVDDLQDLVEEHFGPIPAGEAPPTTKPVAIPDSEPSYFVLANEGVGFDYISLDIPIPPEESGTVGGERQMMMERLIEMAILNRLEDAYYRGELQQVDKPEFEIFSHNRGLRYFGANWQGEDLAGAATTYVAVLETAQSHGFTAADLARVADRLVRDLDHELEEAADVRDGSYARSYSDHFTRGSGIDAAEATHARRSALLAGITVDELTDHYRWLMDRAGPIFIAVGTDANTLPTIADMEAAVEAAAPSSRPPPVPPPIEQLMDAPLPIEPLSTGEFALVEDGFEWRFANGARVVLIPSDESESVQVRAEGLGGWSVLEPGSRALASRVTDAVEGSGPAGLTKAQVDRFLAGTTVSLEAYIHETHEGFSGSAHGEDLETLFQLMHLYITAPRVDDLAFQEALNDATIRTNLAATNPYWRVWVQYLDARFGDDWHDPVATPEQLETITAESMLSYYQRRLDTVDDMVIAVAGDVDAAELDRLAHHYIGTLPAREPDTFANRHRPVPAGVIQREIPVSAGESGIIEMHYEVEMEVTPAVRINTDVVGEILDERLRLYRRQLGGSYIANVHVDAELVPRQAVYSWVIVTVAPGAVDAARAVVLQALADLATNGPTPEEVARAKERLAPGYEKESTRELLSLVISTLYLPEGELLTSERALEELGKVTVGSVAELLADLYGGEDRIEIILRPSAG